MMKRILTILVCIALALTFALTGCGQKQQTTTGEQNNASGANTQTQESSSTTNTEDPMVTPAGTFPIAKEKVTLRVFCRQLSYVKDYVNNEFTKWYEDKTNVHLEWDVVPESDVSTKLNLMLSSGQYPDMIIDPWVLNATQVMIYGQQGVFIQLDDLINKYGVETKKMLDQYPLMKKQITMPDSKIYNLPQVDDFYAGKYPSKMWVYQPWLDKLNLKSPTTTDEFYQVLKAFKEQDPNGNGKADEIPLTGIANVGNGQPSIMQFLMSAFIYTDQNMLRVNNGKVEAVFDKPQWKEGLQYLNKLYKEGLLAPEAFTEDNTQMQQLNSSDIRIGFFPNLTPYGALPGTLTSEKWPNYKAIVPLKGPDGLQVAVNNPYNLGPAYAFVITKACKYPAVAFRWADALYNQEITLRKYYGRPDQEWRYAKPGEIGANGKPAIWASLAKSGGEFDIPTDKSWAHIAPHFRSAEFREGRAVIGDATRNNEAVLYKETKEKYEPYTPPIETVLPPLVFTEKQSTELADLSTTINNFVNEMFARFITGDASLDKDWDTYLQQLKDMNLDGYLKIYQDAYETWNNK